MNNGSSHVTMSILQDTLPRAYEYELFSDYLKPYLVANPHRKYQACFLFLVASLSVAFLGTLSFAVDATWLQFHRLATGERLLYVSRRAVQGALDSTPLQARYSFGRKFSWHVQVVACEPDTLARIGKSTTIFCELLG